MHPPIFVREPSDTERVRLEAALRAPDAFTVRRAQIVLASAEGRRPREIARGLRCATQTVRNGIRAFNATGLAALTAGSSRPRSAAPVLGEAERERLRAILHRPPRAFGHPRSTWTLDLLGRAGPGAVGVRVVPGRPVGGDHRADLAWVADRLAAEGARVLGLLRDNAPWHVGREARPWIAAHNRRVKSVGRGCRLVVCRLP